MPDNYHSYKKEYFSCKHCGWRGLGSSVEQGELFRDGFELNCPYCHEPFPGLILFPTIEETLEKGSKEDKTGATRAQTFQKKWLASLLKDTTQLPEVYDEFIAFILTEKKIKGEDYIVITHKTKTIWREIRTYEYYERFIELGKLLKQKYGDKMIDLVPEVGPLYLYGDVISSIKTVEDFRRGLCTNNCNQLNS